MEPRQLLLHAQRLQAISQAGLAYASSVYDRDRYEEIRAISVQLLGELTEEPFEKIIRVFASEEGYQTPKVDIRALVIREGHEILLVSEKGDQGRWTLPGGWADVGYTPFENAAKEVYEETGLVVRPMPACPLRQEKTSTSSPALVRLQGFRQMRGAEWSSSSGNDGDQGCPLVHDGRGGFIASVYGPGDTVATGDDLSSCLRSPLDDSLRLTVEYS